MSLRFLPANSDQIPLVRSLAHKIFPETYAALLSAEQIKYMLDMMYGAENLQKQFDEGHLFYLLYYFGQPLGYASIQVLENKALLHKLYVDASLQGKGVGGQFINYLEQIALEQEATVMQLYVKRDNPAKGFYDRMGYVVVQEVDKHIGNDYWMRDYLMEKVIHRPSKEAPR